MTAAIVTDRRTSDARLWQRRLSKVFAWLADATQFLGRTAWPILDLLIRLWLGKMAFLASVLIATDRATAVSMAPGHYPIPIGVLQPGSLLAYGYGIAAIALVLGLGTRIGASVLLAFTVSSQVLVASSDLNLFWIALLATFVLTGADRFSLDRMLSRGLRSSPFPQAAGTMAALDATRPFFGDLYLLLLRLAMCLTLLLAGQHVSHAMIFVQDVAPWLPVNSAALLFGSFGLGFALFIGLGLMTRVAAILVITLTSYQTMMVAEQGLSTYWLALLALLFARGPGTFSLDGQLLAALRRRVPELSRKPVFDIESLPHVVIVGAGFGGIACARALEHAPVNVTLVDRQNYHLFQPLLYQVATAALSPADIALPIRAIFRDQFNARVMLATVTDVDTERREIIADGLKLRYDYLVVATGATHSYFGNDAWAPFAPGLKRVDDATQIRSRVLEAFEEAEIAASQDEQQRALTFVVVGGGPTGVELAGSIAELARVGMAKDFRHFDPATAEVILVQAAPRLLPAFPDALSDIARRSLEDMGVKVLLNTSVLDIDAGGVLIGDRRIFSRTVLWAAGVAASPAAKWLGVEGDGAGRVKVNADLSVPNLVNVFVIGDTAAANCWEGRPVPGLAPAAKQAGAFAAKVIAADVVGATRPQSFVYRHMGSLATIGRKSAIADFGFVQLHGAVAWWLWGVVHVLFLLGTKNRLSVAINWLWAYMTYRAATRLITDSARAKPVSS
jgi:NADH dehydrogenase